MGKAEENKILKRESLLNTAFHLFTTKGINNTSISDIVEQAGVAKGTFYLYFKDKYDIRNKLVIHRTSALFENAMVRMRQQNIVGYRERILFVVNDVIDALTDDKVLLMFISKNLGLGFSRYALDSNVMVEDSYIKDVADSLLTDIGDEITNPKLMMYMIIELVGSCIYSSILFSEPVEIDELKPYLYKTINNIIDQFRSDSNN